MIFRRLSIAGAVVLAVCLAGPARGPAQDRPERGAFPRQGRSETSSRPRRPLGHSAALSAEPLSPEPLSASPQPPTQVQRRDEVPPTPPRFDLVQYEPVAEVPTPGDRPAFEKADELIGSEPGEQPPWSLTNLWDYDERRSRSDAGRNPLIERRWHLGGSTVQSFVMNPMGPKDRFNGTVTWTDRSDDYQLNQQWLYLERTTDTSYDSFDIGGRIDFNYGTNYRWMTSAGFEDRWTANVFQAFYGMALPQAYLETAYENVKVKWGHFISPVGYSTVDTTQNFFYTIPYTYQYGEPFTHWGALATWFVDDHLVIGGGFTRGWDNFNGAGSGSHGVGWVGTATYTFDNEASLAYVGTYGTEFNNLQNPNPAHTGRYLQSLVFSLPFGRWNYVAQSDFGTQANTFDFSGTRKIGTARWYGLNQYLFYAQNECVSWGINFEWFRDEEGYRVGTLLPTLSDAISQVRGLPNNRFGYIGNFYQLTFGPKFTPTPHLFIRPNARFDWFQGTAANPGNLLPFDDGKSNNQFILGFDVGLLY